MAVDPEPLHQMLPAVDARSAGDLLMDDGKAFHTFSSFASTSLFAKPRQRKVKRKPVNVQKVGANAVIIGKRKRNVRERSIECELEKISLNSSPERAGGDPLSASASGDSASILVSSETHHSLTDSMDLDMKQEQVSSSSVSGSESDPGFYTYDDGREADDEQSDWYQESGQTWGIVKPCWWENNGNPPPPLPGGGSSSSRGDLAELEAIADAADTDDDAIDDTRFQQLLKGSWQHLSDDAKDAYRLRMQKLRDRIVSSHFKRLFLFFLINTI